MDMPNIVLRACLLGIVTASLIYAVNAVVSEPQNLADQSKNECRAALHGTPQHISERFCRDVSAMAVTVRY